MIERSLIALLLGCLLVLTSCQSNESSDDSADDSGSANRETDAGEQDENEKKIPCQSGLQCTAPTGVGAFICTDPTGTPPLCVDHRDCDFGPCTQYAGQGYCMQSCGPKPVDQCPAGSVCSAYGSGYVCMQSGLSSPPSCNSESCPFGECLLSVDSDKLCIMPCTVTFVDQCPTGTECALFGSDLFYCARPSTGLPDTCSPPDEACSYGICLSNSGTNYCTQGCIPSLVDSCPSGTVCRSIASHGWICSEEATALPKVCQTQADCDFGTCLKNGDKSYCTQYCSDPGIDITGTVFGTGEAVPGVKVCVFENNAPNENLCTTTGAQGEFALYSLPEELLFVLVMTKDGYQSSLQVAIPNSLTTGLIFTEEEITAAAQAAKASYPDSDTGLLAFLALDATGVPVSEYSVSITPASGLGPFYYDENNTIDTSLTRSTVSGVGVFFDLPPGSYSFDFSHASAECGDLSRIGIVSGYLTNIATSCP